MHCIEITAGKSIVLSAPNTMTLFLSEGAEIVNSGMKITGYILI